MGMDPRQLNLDFARLREDLREAATKEVKGALLFEAIAQKENIQASDEDVEKKLEELAEEAKQARLRRPQVLQGPGGASGVEPATPRRKDD